MDLLTLQRAQIWRIVKDLLPARDCKSGTSALRQRFTLLKTISLPACTSLHSKAAGSKGSTSARTVYGTPPL